MAGELSSDQNVKLGKALTATAAGAGIAGGPIAGPAIAALAGWGTTMLRPSKAAERRRKAGAIVDSDPFLANIRQRVEAMPVSDRAGADARMRQIVGSLSPQESYALAQLLQSVEGGSSQLQRQLGRTLFAPEFASGKMKWQGKTLPLGSEGPLSLDAVRAAIGLQPIARDSAPGSTAPPVGGTSSVPSTPGDRFTQAFDQARAAMNLPTSNGGTVPYFNSFFGGDTQSQGGGSPLGGLFGALGQIGSSAVSAALTPRARINVFQGGSTPGALPGGALLNPSISDPLGLGLSLIPNVSMGAAATAGDALTSPWRQTAGGASAQPHIAVNPVSGRLAWFGPLGRPMLWSGDMRACKRVNRIARKAKGRRVGGR